MIFFDAAFCKRLAFWEEYKSGKFLFWLQFEKSYEPESRPQLHCQFAPPGKASDINLFISSTNRGRQLTPPSNVTDSKTQMKIAMVPVNLVHQGQLQVGKQSDAPSSSGPAEDWVTLVGYPENQSAVYWRGISTSSCTSSEKSNRWQMIWKQPDSKERALYI